MMGVHDVPDECGVCDRELDGKYEVKQYEVANPVESGYLNPYAPHGVICRLADGHCELHLPVCKHCDAPETPATPEERPHRYQLAQTLIGTTLMTYGVLSGVATDVTLASLVAIILGLATLGEMRQIGRIREREKPEWKRRWDVEPVLADDKEDPVEDAREAFLAGEIDEDTLEERLDEEFAEDEHERDRETRVVER